MRKALSVMLGASLSVGPVWADTSESDVEKKLQDYEQRLEQLEKQQFESQLSEPDRIRINGFLSAGMSRAEADTTAGEAAYIDGSEDKWSHDSLTRAGVQFNARLNDRAEAVVQLYGSGGEDFDAEIQWAYLDYDLTDTVSVKAGRIVAPFYLHSQYVDVGYAYPWVSLPAEVYQLAPIKTMEAVEAAWSFNTGPLSHRLTGFWGSSTVDGGPRTGHAQFQADDLAGVNLTSRWRDWTVRAAYSAADVTVSQDDLNALIPPAPLLGLTFDEVYTYFAGLGLQYDDGSWFMSAEVASLDFGNWYPSSQSGYVSVGKYLGKWMPLVTWAEVTPKDLDDTLPGPIKDGLAERQKSWTGGVRYSLTDAIALKAEYSYYYDFSDEEVTTTGFFVTDGTFEDDNASVVRLSADLVF
ncbi:MAG: OprO/OprP family phosphate-selective porin [Pseudomonadales bacterium]|nr:OprO/OprP family phosphate-selective porin [Pseudomonadales bacterium]